MNHSKKKIIISLICLVIYTFMSNLPTFYVTTLQVIIPSAIPVVLCGLLCGFPWGPLMVIIANCLSFLLTGGQLSWMLLVTCCTLLTALIPSLMSRKTGTNLSAQAMPSAKMTLLAVGVTTIVDQIVSYLAVWLFFVRDQNASITLAIPSRLVCIAITIAVTVPLALLLGGGKRASVSRDHRSLDDER